jgi:hypothetical protein
MQSPCRGVKRHEILKIRVTTAHKVIRMVI